MPGMMFEVTSPETFQRNCLSHWFPVIQAARLPVPDTQIIRTDIDLAPLADGKTPAGFEPFLAELRTAADDMGYPCFLRTGQGSHKHDWSATCYLAEATHLAHHVFALVEWSCCAEMPFGIPMDIWVIRQLIRTAPRFYAFNGMPITREFRLFVRDEVVEHIQPYWPPAAIRNPSTSEWENVLHVMNVLGEQEERALRTLAVRANRALPGFWSVDFLQGADDRWWLTDMATGDSSYRWDLTVGR